MVSASTRRATVKNDHASAWNSERRTRPSNPRGTGAHRTPEWLDWHANRSLWNGGGYSRLGGARVPPDAVTAMPRQKRCRDGDSEHHPEKRGGERLAETCRATPPPPVEYAVEGRSTAISSRTAGSGNSSGCFVPGSRLTKIETNWRADDLTPFPALSTAMGAPFLIGSTWRPRAAQSFSPP